MTIVWLVFVFIILFLIIGAFGLYWLFIRRIPRGRRTGGQEDVGSSPSSSPSPPSVAASPPMSSSSVECLADRQCFPGNICVGGKCQDDDIPCSNDMQCRNGTVCRDGKCTTVSCDNYKDCEAPNICVRREGDEQGVCFPIDSPCSRNEDCSIATPFCLNGLCKQCNNNDNCPIGEYCSNGICKSHCQHDSDVGTGSICFEKLGHTCPASFLSVRDLTCTKNSDCGSQGYCLNGTCTCVPNEGKQFMEPCQESRDCQSNNCQQMNNDLKVCGYLGGECLNNYDPRRADPSGNSCNADKPFCVLGKCSSNASGLPCSTKNDCGKTGSLFCVNGFCTSSIGRRGDKCNDNASCQSKRCDIGPGERIGVCT